MRSTPNSLIKVTHEDVADSIRDLDKVLTNGFALGDEIGTEFGQFD